MSYQDGMLQHRTEMAKGERAFGEQKRVFSGEAKRFQRVSRLQTRGLLARRLW